MASSGMFFLPIPKPLGYIPKPLAYDSETARLQSRDREGAVCSIIKTSRTQRRTKMKLTFALFLITSTCLLAAGDATKGGAVFAARCKACHGAAGEGNPAIAKAMGVELRHLGSREVQAKSDDDLNKILAAGTGKMKPVTGLAAADAANVVAFVRTLKP
jgi:mono/diheme cytochrome c family protein